jgi:hypothetical protein
MIAQWNPPIIAFTYRRTHQLFELFGLIVTLVILGWAGRELRHRDTRSLEQVLPVILPALTSLHALFLYTEYYYKSGDYGCYEDAAKAVVAGVDPYRTGSACYMYPPLFAQAMAGLYRVVEGVLTHAHLPAASSDIWTLIFYLYQSFQYLMGVAAYFLCLRFCRNVGMKPLPGLLIVTALFLVNSQLIRTLRNNQVNVLILDLILGGILLLERRPMLAGGIVALGGHLKVYPLILVPVWALTRRWRAVAGAILGGAAVVLLQTHGGTRWILWADFLAFSRTFPRPAGIWFRDNILYSIIVCLLRWMLPVFGTDLERARIGIDALVILASLVVFVWCARRYLARERAFLAMRLEEAGAGRWSSTFRLYGHTVDAVALGLIISPLVWEYHYVLAMPLALWAVATRGEERPWQVGIGVFLIYGVPTYDVFLLSDNRIAGLVLLLILTSPERIDAAWRRRWAAALEAGPDPVG